MDTLKVMKVLLVDNLILKLILPTFQLDAPIQINLILKLILPTFRLDAPIQINSPCTFMSTEATEKPKSLQWTLYVRRLCKRHCFKS